VTPRTNTLLARESRDVTLIIGAGVTKQIPAPTAVVTTSLNAKILTASKAVFLMGVIHPRLWLRLDRDDPRENLLILWIAVRTLAVYFGHRRDGRDNEHSDADKYGSESDEDCKWAENEDYDVLEE
jgi:hypothetical protein